MTRMRCRWLALTLAGSMLHLPCDAAILVLKRAFVEKYKNRVAIDVDFFLDKALARPHPPKEDGDNHMAGRAEQVGLAVMAEIMNAGLPAQKPVIEVVKKTTNAAPVKMTGVWRLWFEHPGGADERHVQGAPVAPLTSTAADHLFEVHPVLSFAGIPVLGSVDRVVGFDAHNAEKAFAHYESRQATIRSNADSITIESGRSVFNYVQFTLELAGTPKKATGGGFFVLAEVVGAEGGKLTSGLRRMVLAEGTPPAKAIGAMKKGDIVRVLGTPRINLERVAFEVQRRPGRQFTLTQLPYEIIVVGVIPE